MCLGEGTNDCRKMRRKKSTREKFKERSRSAKVVSISGHSEQPVKIGIRPKVVKRIRRFVRLAIGVARKVNCVE